MAARRQLQLASIADIQGSIQANDGKSSAALVVHGLLFAGLVSVVANLGDTYDSAALGAKIAGGCLLLGAALSFVISVLALTKAVRPHDPRQTRNEIGDLHAQAFFPPAQPKKRERAHGGARFWEQCRRLARLDSDRRLEQEYAAEQVKLAEIRAVQAHAAKRGFRWLRLEIAAAFAFLALVIAVSLDVPALAADREDQLRIEWHTAQAEPETVLRDGASASFDATRPFTLRLVARGGDIERVRLSGALAVRCAFPGGRAEQAAEPIRVERQASGDTRGERTLEYTIAPPCGRTTRAAVDGAVLGEAVAEQESAVVQLQLRAR